MSPLDDQLGTVMGKCYAEPMATMGIERDITLTYQSGLASALYTIQTNEKRWSFLSNRLVFVLVHLKAPENKRYTVLRLVV